MEGGATGLEDAKQGLECGKVQDCSPLFQVGMLKEMWEGCSCSQSGFLPCLGAFVGVCVNVSVVHKTVSY